MTGLLPRIDKRITRIPGGCWEWSGTHNTHGYGMVWFDGRMRVTHVVVYEALVGPVPDGLELDHVCENKGCCNPDPAHLEPVTHAENGRRSKYARRRREQTRCARGHEFTSDNTYVTKRGGRSCRTCMRAYQRAYWHRRRKKTAA